MAKRQVLVCDNCGEEIGEGGASVRVQFKDPQQRGIAADYCDSCAHQIQGERVARRGRPPKAAAVAA